jgi:uncharacterized protein
VLPFLMDETLSARVDLKADRAAGKLVVRNATFEPDSSAEAPVRLEAELDRIALWLGLDRVTRDK